MDTLITTRPFHPSDLKQLTENAAADGHSVYFPSIVHEKDGQIIGYASMAVPIILTWQDSKRFRPADSLIGLGRIEGMLAQQPFICIPCDPASPYIPFLPKAGYQKYFKPIELFIKSNLQQTKEAK